MTSKTVKKNIEDLTRVSEIFTHLIKCKTDRILQGLLKFGEIKIYENFNGIAITLSVHSKLLQYGNQGRKIHLTSFKKHAKKIDNKIYPILKCMLTEINDNIKAKIVELSILQEIQNKKQ